MTIRELAQQNSITVQAVYKKLKQAGVNLSELKDASGKITPEGEQKIREILVPAEVHKADPDELNRLTTEVEKLTTQVEKLTTEVELLRGERDYLRTALEHEQALNGLALQRIALPPSETEKGLKGRFKAFTGWFKKGGDDSAEK